MSNKIPSDTQWTDLATRIKAKVDRSELLDYFHPVGSYYETSDTTFDPNTVWGGTWVEDTAGRVLVAKDTGTFATVGNTGGEETHTLITDEIPSHNHKYKDYWNTAAGSGSNPRWCVSMNTTSEPGGTGTQNAGGDGAHNNLQPYIVVRRWHRTA